MARLGHPVFEFIVDRLSLPRGGSVVDLGCGEGPALHAVARRHPSVRLVGLDENKASIDKAKAVLSGLDCDLRIADLNAALPFGDGVTDAVLCHNVLECLADPLALVNDGGRILRRGGQALLSHVDFDAIVIQGPDVSLNRRVILGPAVFA
jgi:SAM-dependent methyltransferase